MKKEVTNTQEEINILFKTSNPKENTSPLEN